MKEFYSIHLQKSAPADKIRLTPMPFAKHPVDPFRGREWGDTEGKRGKNGLLVCSPLALRITL